MADILHKNFKITVLNMLKELTENVEKCGGSERKTVWIKCKYWLVANLKRNQKFLELKSTVIEMKNSLEGFQGRFEYME